MRGVAGRRRVARVPAKPPSQAARLAAPNDMKLVKVLHAALTAPLWVPGAVGLYTVSRGAHLAVKVKAKLRPLI